MYRWSKNLKLEFKVEYEQDIFSWDFHINLFLLMHLLLFQVNIWYYNFTFPLSNKYMFSNSICCVCLLHYQIPTLSYSPPCALVLNTVLTVVYLARMDPAWCGREGGGVCALPALVPSCVGRVRRPPINLLDYSKVLLDYCISIVIVVNSLLIIMLLLKLLILSLIFFALSWK
jgi:hypothetical protein